MNRDMIEGKISELKGKAKSKWAKLSDDDLSYIDGKFTQLKGALQHKYGKSKDEADKEVDALIESQTKH